MAEGGDVVEYSDEWSSGVEYSDDDEWPSGDEDFYRFRDEWTSGTKDFYRGVESRDEWTSGTKDFYCGVVEGFYGRPWTLEQRRDLFVKMKKMGLNTYMYAPKDDFKHRAHWRELYSDEEAEHLTSLVQAAVENDVIFFYALSPGLDITYSNPKEISALKQKLEQVAHLGCNAFALLFDDIEPELSETDKEVYQSFAHAQVAVANEIYEYLLHPKFAFRPTEYCAARAVPNVQNSKYLDTIGQKLDSKIDIMWTGELFRAFELGRELDSVEDLPAHLYPYPYHPKTALKVAVKDWILEFYKDKNAFGREVINAPLVPTSIPTCSLPVTTSCFATTTMSSTTHIGRSSPPLDLSFQPLSSDLVNSSITTKEDGSLQSMHCNPLPPTPSDLPSLGAEICLETEPNKPNDIKELNDKAPEEMQPEVTDVVGTDIERKQLLESDLILLIDLFYLPFKHGEQGNQILKEFFWLKSHSCIVSLNSRNNERQFDSPEVKEWLNRAVKFDDLTQNVGKLLMKLKFCPNRSLLYDLYPYIWDIKTVLSALNSYIKSLGYKEALISDGQGPFSYLRSLTLELQNLLPLESTNATFLYKPPEIPNNKIYTIRPFLLKDKSFDNTSALLHRCLFISSCEPSTKKRNVFMSDL